MNTQNTVEQLKSLKLSGMAKRYEAALLLPIHELQDAHSLVGTLTQAEVEYREHAAPRNTLLTVNFVTMRCRKISCVPLNGESAANRF